MNLIKIVDVNGKIVYKENLTGVGRTLDLSALPNGLYIVVAVFESEVKSARIIKTSE
jgi:hypothetical protein